MAGNTGAGVILKQLMDPQRQSQEDRYEFPYHYIPEMREGRFSQLRHWSWGYRYLGRLQVVFDLLDGLEFDSLLDVGCGDGRFLREAAARYDDRRLMGIDISARAVALARGLNPELEFAVRDILEDPEPGAFDVVTLLEVIEHVLPPSLEVFLRAAAAAARPGGWVVLTTPHRNEPVTPEHYQHFDAASLEQLLGGVLADVRITPFDHLSSALRVWARLLGGAGRYFVVAHPGLNSLFFRHYLKRCLYGRGEAQCRRLAAIGRRR